MQENVCYTGIVFFCLMKNCDLYNRKRLINIMNVGDRLGDNQRYELLKRLGKGGQGDVWLAVDQRLQRNVAIKTLKTPWVNSARVRFEREATSLAGLKHSNIVQIYDFGLPASTELEDGEAYLVMEYIEGETLRRYIERTSHQGLFPSATDILYLFGAIGEALDFAHQAGIIHRDIKPDNILLDKHNTLHNAMGRPVLTDFGLVKLQDVLTLTGINVGLGTWGYSSPEQLLGQGVTSLSDIYSLGVILYEICTGKRPFQHDDESHAFILQYQGIFPPPNQANPAVSPALNAVILRCMEKEPEKRFPDAKSLVEELAGALNVSFPDYASMPIQSQVVSYAPAQSSWQARADGYATRAEDTGIANQVPGPPGTQVAVASPTISQQSTQPRPSPHLPQTPPPLPPASSRGPAKWHVRNTVMAMMFLALVALVVVASLGLHALFANGNGGITNTGSPGIVGHAFFFNNPNMNDALQINLQNIPAPAAGKMYDAWLLNSPGGQNILLGRLSNNSGNWSLSYTDPQHSNLLQRFNGLEITEDATSSTPTLNSGNKVYAASFAATVGALRQLLVSNAADDPSIVSLAAGGLDNDLLKLGESIMQWSLENKYHISNPVRADEIHTNIENIVHYLDGACTTQDLANVPASWTAASRSGLSNQVGLLDCNTPNLTDGFLTRIKAQLTSVINASGATTGQHQLAGQLVQDVTTLNQWLSNIKTDAVKLVAMNSTQLLSNGALVKNMELQVQSAYAGGTAFDSQTGKIQAEPGIVQIYGYIQQLATFDLMRQ